MSEYKPNEEFSYSKAIIPDSDLIIPAKNQECYWGNAKKTDYEIIHSGHCPFGLYKSWAEIL